MAEIDRLKGIVETLRSENGCPWDRVQTHESLKPACKRFLNPHIEIHSREEAIIGFLSVFLIRIIFVWIGNLSVGGAA